MLQCRLFDRNRNLYAAISISGLASHFTEEKMSEWAILLKKVYYQKLRADYKRRIKTVMVYAMAVFVRNEHVLIGRSHSVRLSQYRKLKFHKVT